MKNAFNLLLGASLALGTVVSGDHHAGEPGFKSIFDGKSLEGWDGNPKFWSVQDGAITGRTTRDNPTQGNTFIIWRGGQLENFELRLQYRIVGGNSGIQYRSQDYGDWRIGGYQADFEAGQTYSGILYHERGRGILAKRGEKTVVTRQGGKHRVNVVGSLGESADIQQVIREEDWNDYTIIARGWEFTHLINGRVTSITTDLDPQARKASGLLALQLHAGPPMTVQFRNIRLRSLDEAPKASASGSKTKRIVFVAGTPSHGPLQHEHNAGSLLLKKCLSSVANLEVVVYQNGWPKVADPFAGADAIIFFVTGGGAHLAIQGDRLAQLKPLMDQGVGFGALHYGVEVPADRGGKEFLAWMGGYFEANWSVNPHWTAQFKTFPDHPISRGVKPFEINDEWYFHMRFPPEMKGVTPILSAVPPPSTMSRPDGHHSGNPTVRKAVAKKLPQHVAWAFERPDGGRGFGFTGAHNHINWGDPNFRKIVLNAALWLAKVDVPANGVDCDVSEADLMANLDPKRGQRPRIKPPQRAEGFVSPNLGN